MVQHKMGLPPAAGRDSTPAGTPPRLPARPGSGDSAPAPVKPSENTISPAAGPAETVSAGDPQAEPAVGGGEVLSPEPAVRGKEVLSPGPAAPGAGTLGASGPLPADEASASGGPASGGEVSAGGGGVSAADGASGTEAAGAGSGADGRVAEPADEPERSESPEGSERPTPPGGSARAAKGESPGKPRGEGWKVVLARVAAGVAGGLTLFASFPPLDWWYCAPLGIALIVASLHRARPRRAAWVGYVAAVAFLVPALAWVRTIGDDVWVMLVAVESLFYAAMAALAALVFRLPAWPLWFGGLWVAMEWARGLVPVGGFPWARAAFSQGESPFTPYAALGGAPLVSFAVVLSGGLLAYAALTRPALTRAGLPRVAVPVALALAVPLLGLAVPRYGDEGRSVNVGIVQGNVPGRGMYALGDEPAVVLKNHAGETKRLAQAVRDGKLPKPDIVVLPENSTDIDPYRDEIAREIIHDSVRDIGVPTLVGAVVSIGTDSRATRSLVWDPVTGAGDYYDKQRLVPFGEYTPFKEIVLALWERAGLVGRQSIPGTKPGDLKLGPVTVGAVNCYEVAYDDTVRGTVRAGGTPLVVQTNNASYALSNLPWQQLAMSKLRAVEHNRAVVTAATTGISAYVTPDGKVSWQTRELVADSTVVTVPVRTRETLATRVGAMPEWALMMMGVAAAGFAAWRGRRRAAA